MFRKKKKKTFWEPSDMAVVLPLLMDYAWSEVHWFLHFSLLGKDAIGVFTRRAWLIVSDYVLVEISQSKCATTAKNSE